MVTIAPGRPGRSALSLSSAHAIETCAACGGQVKVIASIEDPAVIGEILGHRASQAQPEGSRPPARGPPQGELGFP
jgi:hypothetical protein